jgi:hypothetical protein
MIAPQYMQPRKPVLDEPLETESKRQNFAVQTQATVRRDPVEPVVEQVSVPTPVAEPAVEPVAPANNTVYYAELAGQQNVAEQPAQFVAEPASTAAAPAVESEPEPSARKRRKLSVFQQLIVILIEIVVVMILATVYLYITGRIDLPPVVMETIEKGLSLIPFIQ